MASLQEFRLLCSAMVPLCLLVVSSAAPLQSLPLPSLVPAFVWSNHRWLDSDARRISYQTLSYEDLAQKVKHEFIRTESPLGDVDHVRPMDVVLAFIGNKLRCGDFSRPVAGSKSSDLLQVLRTVVTSSNSSVSLPYVKPPEYGLHLVDVLLKSIVGNLGDDESRLGEVITAGACVYKSTEVKRLISLDAVKRYLSGRKEAKTDGSTDLLIVCSNSEVESLGPKALSEGEVLDEVLSSLDELKARYVALYVTDLSGARVSPVITRGRQLGSVIRSGEVFCNEVCQTKAYLLEGLFVGLTLIVILISGLCCMAGITTPSRFEQAKEGH